MDPALPSPPPEIAARPRRRWWVAVLVAAVVLVAAASWITLPYYSEGPGPAREVTPLIRFEGPQRFEPTGRLALTTVSFEQLTPITALAAWLDPNRQIVEESILYPPGQDRDREERTSFSQMDQSKINASYVVLQELTDYPRDRGEGALVEGTAPGCPADDELFPGDLVVSIDGEPIDSYREAGRVIRATPPGREMVFDLDVDGAEVQARFARERCLDGNRPIVGVQMVDAFPFPIEMSSGDIGGPSAGLMWAIGLYELMTPEDLTGGRFIAGTGTLDLEGRVGPIGGIRDKVLAAQEAGAEIFLVPADNMAELEGIDAEGMRLVSVATFDDARRALEDGA